MQTSSGATAVQIVEKCRGVRTILKHVGSAHSEAELAVLMQVAGEELHAGQGELDLDLKSEVVDWQGRARVVKSSSALLWQVLTDAYQRLGFDVIDDEVFMKLVLARLVEPTSKVDTIWVLEDLGVKAPHEKTIYAALKRANERGYRDQIARACLAYSLNATGPATFVMYDVTTLHFENDDEDTLRRVGMSKEHRVDPQVQVGLLVDQAGVPLEMHLFEGNKAETTTLIPVLHAFQARHGIDDIVVVADASMLSAGNLNALEDADRRRTDADAQGAVLEGVGGAEGTRPGHHRPCPLAGWHQGLRHEHPARDHAWQRRHRRLPRPVEGRAVVELVVHAPSSGGAGVSAQARCSPGTTSAPSGRASVMRRAEVPTSSMVATIERPSQSAPHTEITRSATVSGSASQ